jgi:branched-chain amino acid aminotransferase
MPVFEGLKWALYQMRYVLEDGSFDLFETEAKVHSVSRSIHYGLFLAFEGIRFYCKKNDKGKLEAVFLNWDKNLERFRRAIAFNLGKDQQYLVPTVEKLVEVIVGKYLSAESMRDFIKEMAALDAQGYLRPFTVDEDLSIGVNLPNRPSIRAVTNRYDCYMGEPFTGVVMPQMVRAVGINQTGCLKLGVNYLISVKAVDEAKKIDPEAASVLFLDDRTHLSLEERFITEWDASCCLFAFKDGSVIKIPESNLIIPSVTIQGIVAILKQWDVKVMEKDLSYGELIDKVKSGDLVTVCSVGTAGILNRCRKLLLVDNEGKIAATHIAQEDHPIFHKLGEARSYYWDIYKDKAALPPGMKLDKYIL